MPYKYCYILPIAQAVILLVGFFTTYMLAAIVNKDVPAIFPYVSDTGAWSIERCIFSFALAIGPTIMLMVMYIRCHQVKIILETHKEHDFKPSLKALNQATWYMSVIGCVGVVATGCFQVVPHLAIHLTVASIAFGTGWVLLAIQTYISFKIYPIVGSRRLNILRAAIILITGVAMNVCGMFGVLSFIHFEGDDITQYTEESGGYNYHLLSVAGEWVLVVGIIFYIALYAIEFKSLVVHKPKIELTTV